MSTETPKELVLQWQPPKSPPSYHDIENASLYALQLQLQLKLWLTCLEIIRELAFKLPTEKPPNWGDKSQLENMQRVQDFLDGEPQEAFSV